MFEEVSTLICRFQRAFDQQDWAALRDCLDDEIYVDYSSFRGTEPTHVSAEEYVTLRQEALSDLVMQHNHSNLTLSLESDGRASASCNYQIYRFEADGDRHFHSWGTYDFGLARRSGGWKLYSVTQRLLKSEGEPSIHGALRG
ncbi:MAG: nuclear transport factor 2 family protein [Chloroflexota bacterium]|nr:nuclear transport factor 2 family protein [Chloroflexota bacterium]MDE2893951.1 nuclear transport factor 2 family protein [Chloroflexota bacterium]